MHKKLQILFMLRRFAFIFGTLGCVYTSFGQEYPSVLARVNNEIITLNEVQRLAEGRGLSYEKVVEQLIDRKLLIAAFENQKGKVQTTQVDLQMENIVQNNFRGNRQQFMAILQEEGQSIYELKDEIKNSIIENVMRQQNFQTANTISPKKIQRYYQEHQEQFSKPARYCIQQSGFKADATILVDEETLLKKDYLQRLTEQNTNFSTIQSLLNEFSTEAMWYIDSELDPQLATLLSTLPVQKDTPYIKINEVYVTSRLMEKEPASIAPLSEVQSQIEEKLLMEANTQAYKKYIQNLRQKAFIEILYK